MTRHIGLATFALVSSIAHAGQAQSSASACSEDASQRYVAVSGNDKADGSCNAPWQHIQRAAELAAPGSTVNVRGGVYNEIVQVKVSGDAERGPITFRSAPGESAILDGSGLSATASADLGLFTLEDRSYVNIEGFELRNFTTRKVGESPAGIVVRGAGTHIELRNNHVHHISTTAPDSPTLLQSSAFGIVVKGTRTEDPIRELVIDSNEVENLKTGASESLTVNGNVDGFVVSHNKVHDNNNIGIDCIGHEGIGAEEEGEGNTNANDSARNGVVSDNTVYNISSYGNPAYGKNYAAGGIYVDGGNHIVLERNVTYGNDINIEIASEHPGINTSDVIVRNNLIYAALRTGLSVGGYKREVGGTANCTIVNNTFYGNGVKSKDGGELQIQFNNSQVVFNNNIVYARNGGTLIAADDRSGVEIDYNLFYPSKRDDMLGSHNKYADPLFVNTSGTPDLHCARGRRRWAPDSRWTPR